MVKSKRTVIIEFENEECEYCGAREKGLSEHHLIRRSERPDLIKDKKNKVWLCIDCHSKAEHDQYFYKKLQKIFLTNKYLFKVKYDICQMTLHQKLLKALKTRSLKK